MRCGPIQLLVFAAASLAAAAVSDALSFSQVHGAAIAFSSGLYLAVLLLSERRSWPWWTLVALIVQCAAGILLDRVSLTSAFMDALAHVAGPLSAAWLVLRSCRSPYHFNTPRNVLVLAIFTAIPGAAISASAEILTMLLNEKEITGSMWLISWTASFWVKLS